MDPLDPLTEIINAGNAFSQAIVLERIFWLLIGSFFLGAISKSITTSIRNKDSFNTKSFSQNFNVKNHKDEGSH